MKTYSKLNTELRENTDRTERYFYHTDWLDRAVGWFFHRCPLCKSTMYWVWEEVVVKHKGADGKIYEQKSSYNTNLLKCPKCGYWEQVEVGHY